MQREILETYFKKKESGYLQKVSLHTGYFVFHFYYGMGDFNGTLIILKPSSKLLLYSALFCILNSYNINYNYILGRD